MERVTQRDFIERGKSKKQAKKDSLQSWDIYYAKFKKNIIKSNTNQVTITKKTNIEHLLKKIFN